MKPIVAIIDFGAGNLMSITKALEHLGCDVMVTSDPDKILDSDGAVLPGVGAFYDAMKEIDHLKGIIKDMGRRPLLGICLGLQLLFTESEEGGKNLGLDIIKGPVVRFPNTEKVPHMGWNDISIKKRDPILKGVKNGSYYYFVHSYYAVPLCPEEVVLATTSYGMDFPSIIKQNNIYATQFHPEKSGETGLKILKNFVDIVKAKT